MIPACPAHIIWFQQNCISIFVFLYLLSPWQFRNTLIEFTAVWGLSFNLGSELGSVGFCPSNFSRLNSILFVAFWLQV